MSDLEKAAQVVYESCYGRNLHPGQVSSIVRGLNDAGLLAPDVQIIRTPEELEALDPDTAVISAENGAAYYVKNLADRHTKTFLYVPAVVIATGAQVRAAREAMEQDNGF